MLDNLHGERIFGGREDSMRLRLVRSNSVTGTCPTLYATDRGTFVVQGSRIIDSEALAGLDVPAHETVVEVPFELLRGLPVGELTGPEQS